MLRRLKALCTPHGAQDIPYEIAELLRAVQRIPREELPGGAARDALVEAIRCGEVIGVYTATSQTCHTIELGALPRDVDPRTTARQWATWWNAGKRASDEMIAEHQVRVAQANKLWAEREAAKAAKAEQVTLDMLTPNARRQFERGEQPEASDDE